MRVMLDSDAYSKLMRGDGRIGDIVRSAEEIVVPAVVVAELLYAFRQGQRTEQHVDQLRSFLDRPYVSFVPAGPVTADRYARIMDSLRRGGYRSPPTGSGSPHTRWRPELTWSPPTDATDTSSRSHG